MTKIKSFLLYLLFIISFALLGYWIIGGFNGFSIGFIIAVLAVLAEQAIISLKPRSVFFSLIGAVLGGTFALILINLLDPFFSKLVSNTLPYNILLSVALMYLAAAFGYRKGEEVITGVNTGKLTPTNARLKVLDTSVIIDGRILDIADTGFLEGTLIVPKFILYELQQVADSSDPLKRNRGRRGLEVLKSLKALQTTKGLKLEIHDIDYPNSADVDQRLVKIAKQLGAALLTTDYNLNKVAELEGVQVLNINDLANTLKPVVLPNEELKVLIIKEGKDPNQGVGYLDDGTMVVVDNGRQFIGREVRVIVTSILQTAAGRMIFTKIKNKEPEIPPRR